MAFRDGPGYSTDPVNGFAFLREAYAATDPKFSGRVTVPVLLDKETRRIINNSEDDIRRMFNDGFGMLAAAEVDLFPQELRDEQAKLSEFTYENVNNGVYRAGFATNQEYYEWACRALFSALDELEVRLAKSRYLSF